MPRKLKVYRTPIGFHDAYVAASSQKAALEAWGSDANLFARGMAELVTDEELTREPLANPGKVVKRLRGSAEEQFAALSPNRPRRKRSAPVDGDDAPSRVNGLAKDGKPGGSAPSTRTKKLAKPKPWPSRGRLDKAETKLDELLRRQSEEDDDLRKRERALARERRDLERAHQRDRKAAELFVEKERDAHADALSRWREDQ
ncbi:hypothetical protein HZF05_10010 [Sphingomonas sp. CGMCC 1.13654]|uniref:Cell envelope biogenesis protein TolA n=1 Tax=Sphingomonas chungangi TaxID=2683589 RepID=A0A838L6Y1_9SPHN|nr:hypothetical protein [Sphingomonas chungangi]MBA2934432.1 hypothetical protein [Sphingomonas chungangi]MVW57471.1 hypothetical protein [Sphingomonas chungangi]